MATLSAGHLFTDIAPGLDPGAAAVPDRPRPPQLRRRLGAGARRDDLQLGDPAAVRPRVRPALAALADAARARRSGASGVALAGIAPSYALTFAAVVLSGIGVAAFHPEGSRFANYVSGARRSSGMSLFSVGGNIGFALGPVLMTPLLLVFGLHGTVFVLIPTWLMAAVLVHELPRLKTLPARPASAGRVQRGRAPRGLGAVRAARRRDRAALVRLLRDRHVHPAVLRASSCTPARRSATRR